MPCLGLHSVDCFLVNKVGESLAGSLQLFRAVGLSVSLSLSWVADTPLPSLS